LQKIDEKDTLLWGANVTYIICNELNPADIEAQLVPLGMIDTDSPKYQRTFGALVRQQSR
jgi:hypothetical protein